MGIMHEETKLKLSKSWTNKSPAFSKKELTEAVTDLNKERLEIPDDYVESSFSQMVWVQV